MEKEKSVSTKNIKILLKPSTNTPPPPPLTFQIKNM